MTQIKGGRYRIPKPVPKPNKRPIGDPWWKRHPAQMRKAG